MRILALDLGTHTGWATNVNFFSFGVQVFDVKRGESPGMRYIRFNAWLEEMWGLLEPELVSYEQTLPFHRGSMAAEIAAGFATRVQEFCARHKIEHTAVHSATLKKFATGHGRASKEMMKKAFQERYDVVPTSDDMADAGCLLWYSIEEFGDVADVGRLLLYGSKKKILYGEENKKEPED
jgi:Holliday junction resolvasome RuvABC endonuclease subunit